MNRQELESLLQCMVIICAIDGFDSKEFDLIDSIFKEVWDGSLQEMEDLVESTVKHVAGHTASGTVEDEFEEVARSLSMTLNGEHRIQVLDILMKLMKADAKITGSETRLYMKCRNILA